MGMSALYTRRPNTAVIATSRTATSIACRILPPMKDALGSGVPCARLSMPSSRWKVTAAAMLLKHAVITEKEAMDAT